MMKQLAILFFAVLIAQIVFAQNAYDKFYQALIDGDTVLAAQIEKDYGFKTEPIKEKPFPVRNVAEHVFPIGIDLLKDSIIKIFNFENQFHSKILNSIFIHYAGRHDHSESHKMHLTFDTETIKDSVMLFSKSYFSQPNTSNDIFIDDLDMSWPSKLYFSNGKPLEYHASFIIKLSSLSKNETKVVIIGENPKVINGVNGFGVHGPMARYTKVQPTSIEEYTLLLFIADKFQVHNLPPLKLPIAQRK